jgi:hypothetical protein
MTFWAHVNYEKYSAGVVCYGVVHIDDKVGLVYLVLKSNMTSLACWYRVFS